MANGRRRSRVRRKARPEKFMHKLVEFTATTRVSSRLGFGETPQQYIDGIPLGLVDDETFRAFDRRLHQKPSKQGSSNSVRATLRGRIFGRYEGIGGTQQKPVWRGYGHMDCCMLFVVTQVVSIDPSQP
jgi:hypothetical protein